METKQRRKIYSCEFKQEAARWLAQSARKGKSGDVLEIIYTPAKFVRAIKGAPGRVTLGRFQTRLVET